MLRHHHAAPMSRQEKNEEEHHGPQRAERLRPASGAGQERVPCRRVNRLIEQYRRDFVIAEELVIGIIEENNQFEEVNAAHADARHGGNASTVKTGPSRAETRAGERHGRAPALEGPDPLGQRAGRT